MRRAPKGGMWLNGRFYKGGQFLPKTKPVKAPRKPAKAPAIPDDVLVQIALSELPVSHEAAQAMHRYLNGRATQRDRTILDVRKLQAIQSLRDGAATDREWKKWASMYAQAAKGIA